MSQNVDAKTATAISAFLPLLKALILTAEEAGKPSGATGDQKHAAVVEGSEALWGLLQGSMRELRDVPWSSVEALITPMSSGLISIIIGIWNSLLGRVWGFVTGLFKDDDE